MTFKSLEQRFTESSKQIYTRFSNGQSIDPIIPDTAESRSRIKDDSRLLPAVSTVRDVKFISKFITSNNGAIFIAKQLLLQTGNTFAETRLYNPASPILNLIPSLHLVRHFGRPLSNLKTPTRENRGALQFDTIRPQSPGLTNALKTTFTSPVKALSTTPTKVNGTNFYLRPEDDYGYARLFDSQPIAQKGDKNNSKGYTTILSGINVGFYDSAINAKFVLNSEGKKFEANKSNIQKTLPNAPGNVENVARIPGRIEGTYVSRFGIVLGEYGFGGLPNENVKQPRALNLDASVFQLKTQSGKSVTLNANMFGSKLAKQIYIYGTKESPTEFVQKKPFKTLENSSFGNGYFDGRAHNINIKGDGYSTEERSALLDLVINTPGSSSIKDPFNLQKATSDSFYSNIAQPVEFFKDTQTDTKSDIIKFIFSHPSNGSRVHFRAFINAFKETVKPEFTEQRYIGRTERFVTYSGAKRTATLSFNIVAFSKGEIDAVWKRVNYLTGLAFPRGASTSGFMIPPLFRLTIGNIYTDQPVYIDNLEHEFIDEFSTFDIDEEVSQVININMSVSLLEKESKFYDSPFYAIAGN